MEQWIEKIKDSLESQNENNRNPTVNSLLFMLSNMVNELKEYRETGLTPLEIRELMAFVKETT